MRRHVVRHEGARAAGTVHSYTVVHYAANRALADAVPYTVVLVSLDDAPHLRVVGNIEGPVAHRDARRPVLGGARPRKTARSCCFRSGGPRRPA